MRTRAIPLALLTTVLVGCTDDLPSAPSAGLPVAALAAARVEVLLPFRGTLDAASHTLAYDPQTNTFLIHLVGTGTGTHLGRYTLVSDYEIDPATRMGSVRMTITAANGDLLFARGTAQGTPSEDGHSLSTVESLTITGGTGRFAGATGSFTLEQVNLAPDRYSSGSFEGSIRLDR
jgi:hypothetical protein